jgi:hypothetical protein
MLLRRIFFLLALAAAAAQMRDCPGISIDGYKVMLDNVSVVGPQTPDCQPGGGRM